MAYKFPDFLVIGAARCGSTWIHEALKEHSAVCVPNRKKELHFFNRESNFKLGTEYYAAFFNEKSDNRAWRGDSNILCDEKSAARIANILPDAKLIVCLRNPQIVLFRVSRTCDGWSYIREYIYISPMKFWYLIINHPCWIGQYKTSRKIFRLFHEKIFITF